MIKLDARLNYRTENGGTSTIRWYDSLGRASTVGLEMTLEPGFRLIVKERFQKFANDPISDQLDEAYLEDQDYWRVGKQYLPFGRGNFLWESVPAFRVTTNLGGLDVPTTIAIAASDRGKPRGVVARIGGRYGLSAAAGENFSIGPTSLTLIRGIDDSPGVGRGYRKALGADYAVRHDTTRYVVEVATLRDGHSELDKSFEVSDFSVTTEPSKHRSLTLGWTRRWDTGDNFFRGMTSLRVADNAKLDAYVRIRNGVVWDLNVALAVKL